MVARVLFIALTFWRNTSTPPPPGDHKGPPNRTSATLAPTDHPTLCLAFGLRLMPIGRPPGSSWLSFITKNCPANVIYNLLRNPWSSTYPWFSHRRITRHQNIHDGNEAGEHKAPLRGQVILIRADPYAMYACAIQFAKHVCQQRGIEALPAKRRRRSAIPDIGFTRLKTKAQP